MQWPVRGDRATFQRSMVLGCALAVGVTCAALSAVMVWRPELAGSAVATACGLLMLQVLWVHGRAQAAARRREIVRSFAGLAVLHAGAAVTIDRDPLLGEYGSRREAAWAAARCGRWAVLVRAYDRYYVLTGRGSSAPRAAVSFRSKAVADVVPALFEQALPA